MKSAFVAKVTWLCAAAMAAALVCGCSRERPAPPVPTAEYREPYPGMSEARARGGTLVLPRGPANASDGK